MSVFRSGAIKTLTKTEVRMAMQNLESIYYWSTSAKFCVGAHFRLDCYLLLRSTTFSYTLNSRPISLLCQLAASSTNVQSIPSAQMDNFSEPVHSEWITRKVINSQAFFAFFYNELQCNWSTSHCSCYRAAFVTPSVFRRYEPHHIHS